MTYWWSTSHNSPKYTTPYNYPTYLKLLPEHCASDKEDYFQYGAPFLNLVVRSRKSHGKYIVTYKNYDKTQHPIFGKNLKSKKYYTPDTSLPQSTMANSTSNIFTDSFRLNTTLPHTINNIIDKIHHFAVNGFLWPYILRMLRISTQRDDVKAKLKRYHITCTDFIKALVAKIKNRAYTTPIFVGYTDNTSTNLFPRMITKKQIQNAANRTLLTIPAAAHLQMRPSIAYPTGRLKIQPIHGMALERVGKHIPFYPPPAHPIPTSLQYNQPPPPKRRRVEMTPPPGQDMGGRHSTVATQNNPPRYFQTIKNNGEGFYPHDYPLNAFKPTPDTQPNKCLHDLQTVPHLRLRRSML